MAGREVFGKEEMQAVQEVLEKKVLFRYGFEKERAGVFKTAEFEKAFAGYVGSRYALGVSSGTAALKTGLEALNLPKGKEVLTSSFTFVASVESIEEAGLKPVLCEIDESLNIDPADLEKRITPDTVAIMPVHMMGAAARIDRIMEIAKKRNLKVIEDNCQACGTSFRGRKTGTFGDVGAFSFDYVKVITTGEGGMLVTDNEKLYQEADWYHDHGHPHLAGVPRGKEERKRRGFNYRMNEIQAALGLAQLRKIDSIIARQVQNKKVIKDGIKNIPGITFRTLYDETGDIATFLVFFMPDQRQAENLKEKMAANGVNPGVLNYWHFLANIESCGGSFPKTKALLERSVVLEIMTNMEESQLSQIVDVIRKSA